MILFEGVHPLEGGAVRLKYRRDRRLGLPRENPLVFYPRYWVGTLVKLSKYAVVYWRANRTLKEVTTGAGSLDLHRPRHRAAQGRRV